MAARAHAAYPGRRRWPRRLLIGFVVFLSICVVVSGAGYLYLHFRLGQIHRLHLGGLTGDRAGGPMNVLLVGSDSRARLTGPDAAQAGKGQVEGERSDTIMLLHIDPREKKAAILSVPRDLYVPIPGTSTSDRINVAYGIGGPPRLIATITQNLGVAINHYVEVDFVGFKDIVDSVGGVRIYVPAPARDAFSGLRVNTPGCVTLDGTQALGWVRSRHYQYFEAGRWREDSRGDFGRIQRQQDFIRRMMKKAVSSGLTNPIQLNRIIGIGVHDVTMDSAMSTRDIVNLATRFKSLDPDTVEMLTLPAEPTFIAGKSVLRLKQPDYREIIDRLNGRGAAAGPGRAARAPQPAEVRVRVLNGNGADQAATKVGEALQEAGFNVADKGDADSFRYSHTVVRYAPGALAKAQLLQRYLDAGARLEEDTSLRTVDLALVVGADYTGVSAKPGPAPSGAGAASPATTLAPLSPVPVPKGARPAPPC